VALDKDARGRIVGGPPAERECRGPWGGIVLRRGSFPDPSVTSKPYGPAAATIPTVRQLPEQCSSCGRQIATLEACVLPDGTEKRGAEVNLRESAEGGIRCTECAKEEG
jgi:hypothetical protein